MGHVPVFHIRKKIDMYMIKTEEYSFMRELTSSGIILLNRVENIPENYHEANEFYLGIKKPIKKLCFKVIDLT
jgi:hypothetical protein